MQIQVIFQVNRSTLEVGLIKRLQRFCAMFHSSKLYYTTAFWPLLLVVLENVDTDHITCLTHVVLYMFPSDLVAQVGEEQPTTFHLAAVLFNLLLAVEFSTDVLSACLVLWIGGLPIFGGISFRSCPPGFFVPYLLLIVVVYLIHNR